jgi:hypothetical protein
MPAAIEPLFQNTGIGALRQCGCNFWWKTATRTCPVPRGQGSFAVERINDLIEQGGIL